MRKIVVQVVMELIIETEEGIEMGDILDNIEVLSCLEQTDCTQSTIISHEVKDSK